MTPMTRRGAAVVPTVAVMLTLATGPALGSTRGRAQAHDGRTGPTASTALMVALQAQAAQPAQPAGKSDDFVPVTDLPKQEQLPAAPLLIAAYAVVWVSLLAYVVMLWRRLARVEQEIAGVARRIDAKRRD